MAAQSDERVMISERIAPGMLPRVLNSFDMLYASGVIGMLASASAPTWSSGRPGRASSRWATGASGSAFSAESRCWPRF